MSEVDITKAAEDLANEKLAKESQKKENQKLSELEQELAKYKAKELEEKRLAEQKEKDELKNRLETLEKASEEKVKVLEDKLEKLSTRQSSGKVVKKEEVLSREEYLANKSEYDRMLAKHILENKRL